MTLKEIGGASRSICENFLSAMGDVDPISFFPMWLRQNQWVPRVIELSYWESILAQQERFRLQNREAFFVEVVRLNPTLQKIVVDTAAEALGIHGGVYLFCSYHGETRQIQATPEQSEILERISEDVVFVEGELASESARNAYSSLVQGHFILVPERVERD